MPATGGDDRAQSPKESRVTRITRSDKAKAPLDGHEGEKLCVTHVDIAA